MNQLSRQNKDAKGFTLVEIAVVVLIVGIMIALAIAFALPVIKTAQRIETEEKMTKIATALNYYAVHNYRLPCPALPNRAAANPPYGFEQGSGAAGDVIPAPCLATVGIIPFNTLGLSEDNVYDGYGRPFTYSISPVFTQDTSDNNNLAVHPACRTIEWYHLMSSDDTGAPQRSNVFLHKAPRKARFCCPDEAVITPATDLIIQDGNGNNVVFYPAPGVRNAALSATAANTVTGAGTCPDLATCNGAPEFECCTGYNTVDIPFSLAPNAAIHPNDRITALAYTLVSHGPNGLNAAFNLNTGARPVAAPADPFELENWNDDNIFRDVFTKSDVYDDILFWRTQDLIFAEQGESCVVP